MSRSKVRFAAAQSLSSHYVTPLRKQSHGARPPLHVLEYVSDILGYASEYTLVRRLWVRLTGRLLHIASAIDDEGYRF